MTSLVMMTVMRMMTRVALMTWISHRWAGKLVKEDEDGEKL